MEIKHTSFGIEISDGRFKAQFGNRYLDKHSYSYYRVKQTHSDIVVEASSVIQEADAHFTLQKNTNISVFTADCIPALVYCPKLHLVAAIHAGWRGVANQVAIKCLSTLKNLGSEPSRLQVFLGPHIQQQSFEVGADVAADILRSVPHISIAEKQILGWSDQQSKMYLDLNAIFLRQLDGCGVKPERIYNCKIDTVQDLSWHSHRRDKDQAGRNMSFISLT